MIYFLTSNTTELIEWISENILVVLFGGGGITLANIVVLIVTVSKVIKELKKSDDSKISLENFKIEMAKQNKEEMIKLAADILEATKVMGNGVAVDIKKYLDEQKEKELARKKQVLEKLDGVLDNK